MHALPMRVCMRVCVKIVIECVSARVTTNYSKTSSRKPGNVSRVYMPESKESSLRVVHSLLTVIPLGLYRNTLAPRPAGLELPGASCALSSRDTDSPSENERLNNNKKTEIKRHIQGVPKHEIHCVPNGMKNLEMRDREIIIKY